MPTVSERLERFGKLNREMRLQLLLNHARKFPDLPEGLREARDQGMGRVEECQTPLFLWVAVDAGGLVHIHADAPPEAPTVRGFVGFLIEVLEGRPAEDVAELPEDLLERMGLAEVLGVVRMRGLSAVLYRIRRAVAETLDA